PASKWVIVSFRDAQPPVVLGFLGDAPPEVVIKGKPGAWSVQSAPSYQGWVRVAAPTGAKPMATNTAAALGTLTNKVALLDAVWSQPSPTLVSAKAEDNGNRVTMTWTYSQPNAIVPFPCLLAPLGGYPIRLMSPVMKTEIVDQTGPVQLLDGTSLTVQFPVMRILAGRALTLGQVKGDPLASASPFD